MANNISGGGCFKTYPSTNLDYTSGAILPIANIKVLRIRLRKPDPSNPYVNTWVWVPVNQKPPTSTDNGGWTINIHWDFGLGFPTTPSNPMTIDGMYKYITSNPYVGTPTLASWDAWKVTISTGEVVGSQVVEGYLEVINLDNYTGGVIKLQMT